MDDTAHEVKNPPTAWPAPTDVVALLDGTAGLLTRDPAMRDVHVDATGSAPPVPVDPHQLQIPAIRACRIDPVKALQHE